jgi:hypothetical protein
VRDVFAGHELVQLEFAAEIAWMLNEEEIE